MPAGTALRKDDLTMNVREIASEEFGNCIEMENDGTELLVTLDHGPRIVSIRKNGVQFIYNGIDPAVGRSCGHKMRITLEKSTNGIYCDNFPVRYSPMGNGVRFVQTVTDPAQMEVIMDVCFTGDGELSLEHSIYNKSREGLKLSIYTETPFYPEGFVFISQGKAVYSERPGKIMTLWKDCKWSDERLFIGDEYVTVKTAASHDKPRLKIGINDTMGVAGFIGRKCSLIKRYTHNSNALYPFYNCSAFATENNGYLSLQMTSPFYIVEPEEAARHTETWEISSEGREVSFDNENGIRSIIEE